ncbi:MAG: CPBP family intramembrane metalloprotease [Ruminococcus sp.]|nr:CPBP family intramembrane metalloprotease [Ruminococcus sp.]
MIGSEYAKAMEIENESEYISKLTFMIPLAIILNPIAGLISCLGEELAWRAYLLPRLNKRFSIQISVILNGIIWGLWHAPIIATGYNYGNENITIGIIAMIIFCTIIGTISSYLFYKTKSVWCSVIFHTSLNGIDKYRPSELFMSKNSNMFIGPDLLGLIGGIGFIIISIILFTRLKKENMIKGVKINAHTISRQNPPENS